MINKSNNENLPDEFISQVSMFLPQLNKTIIASPKNTILEILNNNNIMIYAPCGGKGVCGKCKVLVHGKVNAITGQEKKVLSDEEVSLGTRLACKTYIESAAEVRLIDTALENHTKEMISHQIQYSTKSRISKHLIKPEEPTLENSYATAECLFKNFERDNISLKLLRDISNIDIKKDITATFYENKLIAIDQEDTTAKKYGVAIDIGTTTLACYLIDLNTGVQLAVHSKQNPQAGYGADVVSRIHYCLEEKNALVKLSKCIHDGVNSIIGQVACKADINPKFIYECVLVGNTTMNHLFLGLNTDSLAQIPFNPVMKETVFSNAMDFGIDVVNENARVTFLPNIGGFVGSDTVGCIIEADLIQNCEKCRVLIDLGTNGEIVLSSFNGIFACSTAAGPAFEGANISCGMQAFEGAINSLKIEDDITYTTINNKPEKGICGSALIDITAEFLRIGLINASGRIVEPEKMQNKKLSKRIIAQGRNKKIIIAYAESTEHKEDICISQKDIREIQLAKAAIMSGVKILLKSASLTVENIDEILLAGAFGNFIDKSNSQTIGLFPEIGLENVISLGNAAGGGAKIYLTDESFTRKKLNEDFSKVKHIELSTHPDFQNHLRPPILI